MFLSWKQNWGVDGLINHHRLSRTVVTMESLLEAFATRTRGVFCKKLDLIVSLMRGEHNITSWWFFESPGDCFWTDEWRGKLTTSWPKYWSWSTWTTGHSIMYMKAKMKEICSNFLCLDIWCPWLIKYQSNAAAVVSIKISALIAGFYSRPNGLRIKRTTEHTKFWEGFSGVSPWTLWFSFGNAYIMIKNCKESLCKL